MSLVTQQWEFLQDVAKLIQYAQTQEIVLTGGELYRTEKQQQIYFDEGKSKTMKSKHLKRLAIDFNFFIDGELVYDVAHPKLIALGKFWENLSPQNEWGGFWQFKDAPHFQRNEI